eukprot:c56371_g1_i1.p1 GENE.c56371_g1_i1~~c56371_g1_i1.p1  ORF type:complete len:405 (+),score=68.71 c56371_g1_i1:2-1216(+)
MYIYTSGTTGMPKAATVTHYRMLMGVGGSSSMAHITAADRVYCVLPLYHSAAAIIGFGFVLYGRATLLLRDKFSASAFTADIRKYRATVFQYIGELPRYLLAVPPSEDDSRNTLRLAMGNGMRADVWEPFRQRWAVPRILEFYAATEGAAGLFNLENKTHAIGYLSPVLNRTIAVAIVRYDRDAEDVYRDAAGHCVHADVNEPGEFMAKIVQMAGGTNYAGYTSKEATSKKVLRNPFGDGADYFRSGDLIRKDAEGFVYFVDRLGDDYRWRGENTSSVEVAEICGRFAGAGPGVEFTVYGVKVGAMDGKAGMAAVSGVAAGSFPFAAFTEYARANLAAFQIPLFLRFVPATEMTSTFKQIKVQLRAQGFDPAVVPDPLFFFNGSGYVPLDAALHARIIAGEVRV